MIEDNRNNLLGNPAVLKQVNLVRVMNRLRFGGSASKAELARQTGLDAKTITNICKSLLESGLIKCGRGVREGRGRPAEQISINADAAFSIGVDIGAQQVAISAVDLAGGIRGRWHQSFNQACDCDFLMGEVECGVREVLDELGDLKEKLEGIGVCVPGFMDRQAGKIIKSVNIRGCDNFEIVDWIRQRFGIVAMLEESSRSMAFGEVWFGGGETANNFICVDLGYGIGMGVIREGALYRGANERCGEIGHMVVEAGGEKCICGQKGCLETIASGRILAELASELNVAEKELGAEGISKAALQGDQRCQNAMEKAGHYIGIAIANVINLFDPEYVVLAGGLTKAGDAILVPLKKAVVEHSIGDVNRCEIKLTELDDSGGAMGAAMLVLRKYFEFENIRFS